METDGRNPTPTWPSKSTLASDNRPPGVLCILALDVDLLDLDILLQTLCPTRDPLPPSEVR